MMPASKHGDPQLGVDIHLCIVPPSPSPVPLPTPHTSIVFDPFDYLPIIGATVSVCGMKRATAGTNGIAIHIPPGFPFAPKLPDKDDELFMGSATVIADGDPFSFLSVPVLSCQVAGMMSPFRPRKKGGTKAMVLPTVFNLAIPTTVFVGGPPTISLMGMAFKGAFAALGKLAKSGVFKRIRQKLFKNVKPGFLKCAVLRAEPVNILTGEVVVEQEDFTLPGRIPIEWVRSYSSGNARPGACGFGWETPVDTRLEVDPLDGTVTMQHPTVGPLFFERLPAAPGDEAIELELMDGARLSDHGAEFRVRTKANRLYHFPKALASTGPLGATEYPIGRISDLCGNWLEFARRDHEIVEINESAGRRVEIVRADGRIREVALTVPGMAEFRHVYVRYDYNPAGDLTAARDAGGNARQFAYDEHHLVRHTDRLGQSFYYEFDSTAPSGRRVVHAWGDGGLFDYRFAYDDILSERRITDSLRHVWLVKVDERGLPIAEIDPLGGATIYEYDDHARTVAVSDAGGRRTEYEYDERGNTLQITHPDSTSLSSRYDDNDKAVEVVDATGAAWRQRWNDRGLLVEQRSPADGVSIYEYDRYGQITRSINPRGATTELGYDAAGQLLTVTDALGHVTRFVREARGLVVGQVDALGRHTRYDYDARGQLTGIELPSGATVSCRYDTEGNLIWYRDENGAVTCLEYGGLGELTRRVLPDGHAVAYLYDSECWLVGVRNQRGELYRLTRDACGRIIEEVDYWGQTRRYAYDRSGHLITSVDPLDRRIEFECDPLGRVVKRTAAGLPESAEPFEERFEYDAIGRLVAAANPHAEILRRYDTEGRVLAETQVHAGGERFEIEHVYDSAGNRVERLTSTGHRVAYTYDLLDRVSEIRIDDGCPIQLTHDAIGQTVGEKWSGLERCSRYGIDGRLREQSFARNGAALFATRYEYDLAGDLVQRCDTESGTDLYAYDPVGRLLQHVDPLGQLERVLADEAGDRLVAAEHRHGPLRGEERGWSREAWHGDTQYRFDRAGNLAQRIDGTCQLELTWDACGRLTASRATGSNGRSIDTVYGYDPMGRRLFKETSGRRTWFGWDGDAMVLDSDEKQTREFVYDPMSFRPRALIMDGASAAETFLYACDPNGRPTRLIDDAGRVRWSATYAAWGHASERALAVTNPLRLQGQYADAETGLHYNRHRYYDCDAGIYVSLDPIGLIGGDNLQKLGDNVDTWIDPLGLAACSVATARRLADKVPDDLKKIFKCKEFAAELRARMQRKGLNAEEIILKSDTGFIYSNAAKKVISTNGDHVGIKVGDHVFDNLNPQGIHINDWMRDLGVGFPGMRNPSIVPF